MPRFLPGRGLGCDARSTTQYAALDQADQDRDDEKRHPYEHGRESLDLFEAPDRLPGKDEDVEDDYPERDNTGLLEAGTAGQPPVPEREEGHHSTVSQRQPRVLTVPARGTHKTAPQEHQRRPDDRA